MKKLKIYLDTSVIGHLDATHVPERHEDTHKLWQAIQAGKYEAYISPVVMGELNDCKEPTLSVLLRHLLSIKYTELQETEEVSTLAAKYLKAGILKEKCFDDCQHIAYACVYNCDMVISWNFRHLVNIKTISGVKSVNAIAGYKEMPIYTPTILVAGGD